MTILYCHKYWCCLSLPFFIYICCFCSNTAHMSAFTCCAATNNDNTTISFLLILTLFSSNTVHVPAWAFCVPFNSAAAYTIMIILWPWYSRVVWFSFGFRFFVIIDVTQCIRHNDQFVLTGILVVCHFNNRWQLRCFQATHTAYVSVTIFCYLW